MRILVLFALLIVHLGVADCWCFNTTVPPLTAGETYSVVYSPDDKYVVSGHQSGEVIKRKLSTLSIVSTYNFAGNVYKLAYSRDGNYIAISGNPNTIHIINATSFQSIISIDTGMSKPYGLDFRYDSQMLLVCGYSSTIKIYRVSDWSIYLTTSATATYYASCRFNKDDKFAALGLPSFVAFDPSGNLLF